MAKRKTTEGAVAPTGDLDSDAESRIDPFLATQLTAVRRMTEGAVGGSDRALADKGIIVVPFQAFSQRYLFGNTGFPIGRMTELVGRSYSCKSAFLYEMYRWHLKAGGIYKHILTEPKDSADLRRSITGIPDGLTRNRAIGPLEYLDYWQKTCMSTLHAYEQTFPKVDGLSTADILTIDGVDSLAGVTTKKAAEEIYAEGSASPGFSPIARAITDWARVYFPKMAPYPISFVGVNHYKDKPNGQGLPLKTIPGGAALQYAATFVLIFNVRKSLEKGGYSVREVEIRTDKNCASAAGEPRDLNVNMTWYTDEETAEQHTVWDWHSATTTLILSFADGSTQRKKIDKIVRIEDWNKATNTASCPTFKMKKASLYDIGLAIDGDPEVSLELDNLFSIRRRHAWRPGVPYSQQMAEAAATPLYSPSEPPPAGTPEE